MVESSEASHACSAATPSTGAAVEVEKMKEENRVVAELSSSSLSPARSSGGNLGGAERLRGKQSSAPMKGGVAHAVLNRVNNHGADGGRPRAVAASNGVSGYFVPRTFQARYQRNNKRGGLKNLRCFPECGVQHKERGFCGRAVLIRIKHPKLTSLGKRFKPVCWARFVPATKEHAFRIGQSLPLSSILAKERTKQNPLKEWIRGKMMEDLERLNLNEGLRGELQEEKSRVKGAYEVSDIAFNVELKGWHYGYVSNKHSCNSKHCLEVVVFNVAEHLNKLQENMQTDIGETNEEVLASLSLEALANMTIQCEAVFRSTSFQLFCRRRRRFQLEPTAPISKPASKANAKGAKAQAEPDPETASTTQGSSSRDDTPPTVTKQSKRPLSALKKEGDLSSRTNEQGEQQKQRTEGLLSLASAMEYREPVLDIRGDEKRVRELGPTSMFWREGELLHVELERGSPRKVADYEPVTSPDDALLLLGLKNVQDDSGAFGEVT